jgi:acyl-CoA thioester hydrolase
VTSFPFALRVAVRFRDLDGMGHVNNAVYFTYIEAARTEYMMKVAGITRLEDVDWIVASASLNFRKAVGYGDPIEVRVRPTKIGTTSYTLYYEIWDAGKNELVAEGETVLVSYDYKSQMKKPIEPAIRKALERDAAS